MDQTYDLVRLGYDGILLRSVSFLVLSDPFKYDSVKNLLYNCRVKLLIVIQSITLKALDTVSPSASAQIIITRSLMNHSGPGSNISHKNI